MNVTVCNMTISHSTTKMHESDLMACNLANVFRVT